MGKINFNATIFAADLKTPLRLNPPAKDEAPTAAYEATELRHVVGQVLLHFFPTDHQTPMLKYRLYTLHHRVQDGGEHELDANDIDLIEKRSAALNPVFVYGQVSDLLNGRSEPANLPLAQPAPPPAFQEQSPGGPAF